MTKQKTQKEMFAKLVGHLERLIKREEKTIAEFRKSIAETKSLEYVISWGWQETCIAEFMKNEYQGTLGWINAVLKEKEDEGSSATPEGLLKERIKKIDEWFMREGFRANSTSPQSNLHHQFEGQALARVKKNYNIFV